MDRGSALWIVCADGRSSCVERPERFAADVREAVAADGRGVDELGIGERRFEGAPHAFVEVVPVVVRSRAEAQVDIEIIDGVPDVFDGQSLRATRRRGRSACATIALVGLCARRELVASERPEQLACASEQSYGGSRHR